MVLFLVAGFLTILYFVRWYKARRYQLGILKRCNIPGPEPHFVHGNFTRDFASVNNVPTISKWFKEFGDTFGYFVGSKPNIVTRDIELLKLIQIKDFNKFTARRPLAVNGVQADSRIGGMLTIAVGNRWKQIRSILTPTFNAIKMKQTVPMIDNAIEAMLANIEDQSAGGDKEVDIYGLFQGLTMDTIGRSAFGIRTDVQRNPDDKFLKAARDVFSDQSQKLVNVFLLLEWYFPEWINVIYPFRYIINRVIEWWDVSPFKTLYGTSYDIINARRANIKDPDNPWERHDMLQQMIEANMSGEQLTATSDADLAANMDTPTKEASSPSPSTSTSSSSSKTAKKLHYMTNDDIASNSVLFFQAVRRRKNFHFSILPLSSLFHPKRATRRPQRHSPSWRTFSSITRMSRTKFARS